MEANSISSGIAIGKAFIYRKQAERFLARPISSADVEAQKLLVDRALQSAKESLEALSQRPENQENLVLELIQVQAELCADPLLREKIFERIQGRLEPFDAAIRGAVEEFRLRFLALGSDYYAARAEDVGALCEIILRAAEDKEAEPERPREPCVLFARELTVYDTIRFQTENLLALVTQKGARTSHTAILANHMRIPALTGVDPETVVPGQTVIVDANKGVLLQNPSQRELLEYTVLKEQCEKERQQENELRSLSAETKDQRTIELCLNISKPADAALIRKEGAAGIGLFRTEFLFLSNAGFPDETAQFEAYREAVVRAKGALVTIRTMDIGGDKLPRCWEQKEENPFLGQRAIRYCLAHPEIFKTQLRAILRAAEYGPVRVMFPMICCPEELIEAKRLLEESRRELCARGIPLKNEIHIGIMIEVPAAAILAERFAEAVDFVSIGTNDLCQYTMAADRTNERVSSLCRMFHPAVLRLIENTVKQLHAAGKPVCVCGEMAGVPEGALLLAGFGVDELSMNAGAILTVKSALRKFDSGALAKIAAEALNLAGAEEVEELLKERGLC